LLGLVLGLGYPLTAWFAALEIGIPASIVGGVVGFVVGLIATAGRWLRKRLL
jgi:hypothetical protein